MKKLLAVLAVVMLAAFAAPAFAATNPFMDVPASHWAYDAVAQLAARGVISGYPDGTFKGPQPATRYEIASIIARSLAYVDMDKASKQDVEMMRRLIVEFSDELSALGVTVDGFEGRLGQLESDIGGWRLSGVFEFNAKFGSNGDAGDNDVNTRSSFSGLDGKSDFDVDKYRIFLDKRINETTSFHARIGKANWANGHADNGPGMAWEFYYITTKLGYDITLDAGRFEFNWEDALGLVGDNDPFVGNVTTQQFRLTKDWGLANLQFAFGRLGDHFGDASGRQSVIDLGTTPRVAPDDMDDGTVSWRAPFESFLVAGLADFTFNEKFQAGLMAYYTWTDQSLPQGLDVTELDLGVYAKFNFTPSVALKGVYYYQDSDMVLIGVDEDDAGRPVLASYDNNFDAWKVVLKVEQDLLKFTDLQLEYAQIDALFRLWNDPYKNIGNNLLANMPENDDSTVKVFGVKAAQKWGESRWNSWIRYYHADYDDKGVDDVQNFGLGIGYQLNPAVHLELAVDYIDYGKVLQDGGVYGNDGGARYVDDDVVVRFQTLVNF
jgi:hypothetical protein